MNPEDMQAALGGVPMPYDVVSYGIVPVALLALAVLGVFLNDGKPGNPWPLAIPIGLFGWAYIAWSAVSKYGDKAIGQLWADQLGVLLFCVPIFLGACFFLGAWSGLSGNRQGATRTKNGWKSSHKGKHPPRPPRR